MSSETDIITEPYLSRPLDTKADSIRLVTIEREKSTGGHLVCHLETVTFAQRPQYDALSYRWGDESPKKQIVLDGIEFDVTYNLWDALHSMHKNPRKLPIWIDALAINQRNVEERSQQIRIMPHIYTRATTVVVWLGAKYDCVPGTTGDVKDRIGESIYDEYWNRVWILQEIGKARSIDVCLGRHTMKWDEFIEVQEATAQTLDRREQRGPFKLQTLRKNKYNGDCELVTLLINHMNAACKDPRDKIYGLVGLAFDARGFPMDYKKTLYEVWIDTMNFLVLAAMLPRSDFEGQASFAGIVRFLLEIPETAVASGIVQFKNALENKWKTPEGPWARMKFNGQLLGEIVAVGPTSKALLSSVQVAESWESLLQKTYPDDIASAYEEYDAAMNFVLQSSGPTLRTLANVNLEQVVFWPPENMVQALTLPTGSQPAEPEPPEGNETTQSEEPRFALLKVPIDRHKTRCKLALVPGLAAKGDNVYSIGGANTKKVIIRRGSYADREMHAIGTAVMVRDVMVPKPMAEDADGQTGWLAELNIDVETFYVLVFGNGS